MSIYDKVYKQSVLLIFCKENAQYYVFSTLSNENSNLINLNGSVEIC